MRRTRMRDRLGRWERAFSAWFSLSRTAIENLSKGDGESPESDSGPSLFLRTITSRAQNRSLRRGASAWVGSVSVPLLLSGVDDAHPERTFIELYNLKTRQISQLPGSQGIFAQRWSPDGRYIIAITVATNDKLMLYEVKNQKWRQLDTIVTSFGYIAWSRDSAYVYFDTVLSGDAGYYRLRISDSKLEKLADLKKVRQFHGQFGPGSWTGLAPGDVPLLPRDISTQEIYAFDLQLP
jgi:hypothetical protein